MTALVIFAAVLIAVAVVLYYYKPEWMTKAMSLLGGGMSTVAAMLAYFNFDMVIQYVDDWRMAAVVAIINFVYAWARWSKGASGTATEE